MQFLFLPEDYRFFRFCFHKYQHTDARKGCDLHFLALLVKGTARFVTEKETLTIRQGEVFYIPRGLQYRSYWYGLPEIEFLSFGFLHMPMADRKSYSLQVIQDETLPELLEAIPAPGKEVDSRALVLFYSALSRALPKMRTEGPPSGQSLANQAMAYMRRHPYIQIPEVAEKCGVSQPHLYETFRRVTGTTPNDYRQSVLCQLAVELLTTTDKTVEEISTLLRFSSPAYLRKVLRKHSGMTPKEIRKNAAI